MKVVLAQGRLLLISNASVEVCWCVDDVLWPGGRDDVFCLQLRGVLGASDKNRIYDDATVSAHQKKERSAIPHSMGRSAKTTMMYVNPHTIFADVSNA